MRMGRKARKKRVGTGIGAGAEGEAESRQQPQQWRELQTADCVEGGEEGHGEVEWKQTARKALRLGFCF